MVGAAAALAVDLVVVVVDGDVLDGGGHSAAWEDAAGVVPSDLDDTAVAALGLVCSRWPDPLEEISGVVSWVVVDDD